MSKLKLGVMFLCLTLVVLAIPIGVNAGEWDKKTIVTFSNPVEIPGVGVKSCRRARMFLSCSIRQPTAISFRFSTKTNHTFTQRSSQLRIIVCA